MVLFLREYRGQSEFIYAGDIPFSLKDFVEYHREDNDNITQLDANINLAKHFTIYPEIVVIEDDGNKDTNAN